MKKDLRPFSIRELRDEYLDGNICFPNFQREVIWNDVKCNNLIDSLYRGWDVNLIYFYLENGKYQVIEGQQRIYSILRYLGVWKSKENEKKDPFPLEQLDNIETMEIVSHFFDSKELSGKDILNKKYVELPNKAQQGFLRIPVNVMVMEEMSEAEQAEQFRRLGKGIPLSQPEKRNAILGPVRDFCHEIGSEHSFFKKHVSSGGKRFAHDSLVSQCLMLESSGNIVSLKHTILRKLYEDKGFNTTGGVAKALKSNFDYLSKVIDLKNNKGKEPMLRNSMTISMYWFISCLRKKYALSGKEESILEFIIFFWKKYIENKNDEENGSPDFFLFANKLANGADGKEAIESRHNIIMKYFEEFCDENKLDFSELDPKRFFSSTERAERYTMVDGKDEMTGEKIPFEKSHADHIHPWSKGGKTEWDNLQNLEDKNNSSLGNGEKI